MDAEEEDEEAEEIPSTGDFKLPQIHPKSR
jgi:hypothetical protein